MDTQTPITLDALKRMLRISAAMLASGQAHLLPLVQRLEADYAHLRKSDPAAYAKELLQSLE